jgi:hypothetical protein
VDAKVGDPSPLARGLKRLPDVTEVPDLAGTLIHEHPCGIGMILAEPLQDVGRPLGHGYSPRLPAFGIGRREQQCCPLLAPVDLVPGQRLQFALPAAAVHGDRDKVPDVRRQSQQQLPLLGLAEITNPIAVGLQLPE